MKSFKMCRLPILIGLGAAALFLTPTSKAQEVSADHFTDTGVQNVYENAPVKASAPKPKKTVQVQAQRQAHSPAVLEATERASLLPAQVDAQAVADKRKPVPKAPKKQ